MLKIEEVHFNHEPTLPSGCALSLRVSHEPGTRIQAPEWRSGHAPLACAYAAASVRDRLTIKARFSGGPKGAPVKIRAIRDEWDGLQSVAGTSLLRRVVLRLCGHSESGILGRVGERVVTFDDQGLSGLIEFDLRDHGIRKSAVGIFLVRWTWQARQGGAWVPFGYTEHRVYVVIDTPQPPWCQVSSADYQDSLCLPWTEALDVACAWAKGAKTKQDVARLITEDLNRSPLLSYAGDSAFVTAWGSHLLSSFLRFLKFEIAFRVNCSDCASAVVALSNILGCSLWDGGIHPINIGRNDVLITRKILLIGNEQADSGWQERSFDYHEVAWWRTVAEEEYVYDACLQLDLSDGNHLGPYPYLATKMKFAGVKEYCYYLLKNRASLNGGAFRRPIQ